MKTEQQVRDKLKEQSTFPLIGKPFTLQFSNMIGKRIILRDNSDYYCGDFVEGRFYMGVFGGTSYNHEGIYFIVDREPVKVSNTTQITFL